MPTKAFCSQRLLSIFDTLLLRRFVCPTELNYYSFNTWNSTAVSTTIALVMV